MTQKDGVLELSKQAKEIMKEVFERFDSLTDHYLDCNELKLFLITIGHPLA